jgi:hypothetical protein
MKHLAASLLSAVSLFIAPSTTQDRTFDFDTADYPNGTAVDQIRFRCGALLHFGKKITTDGVPFSDGTCLAVTGNIRGIRNETCSCLTGDVSYDDRIGCEWHSDNGQRVEAYVRPRFQVNGLGRNARAGIENEVLFRADGPSMPVKVAEGEIDQRAANIIRLARDLCFR